ncbi:MAG: alpha/beta fold hydrolase [Gammaproteobacteria bacterium]|nr:alpha/beta fold hydrolase [Gammaproteobacteria bacterium]
MRFLSRLAAVATVIVAVIATIWLVRAFEARNLPELKLWHQASLVNEFTVDDYPDGLSLEAYFELEERLMQELETQVVAQVPPANRKFLSRYTDTSPINPENLPRNWNRSFQLSVDEPRGGILLLHGASDSPYSMRAVAEVFHRQGFHVLALRLPGHGTVPAGLKDATAADWMAITRLGVSWLRERLPGSAPLYLGGYSTGATLVVDYTLDALVEPQLEVPDRLFLFSPAIGISRFAAFAHWDVAISKIPYFEKFAWGNIHPEYDPFKYNSFAKNAGDIVHTLTVSVGKKILKRLKDGQWRRLPPILAFHSLIDSTVSTTSVVTALFGQLDSPGHELVLFDLNRDSETIEFVKPSQVNYLRTAGDREDLPYRLTLVTNRDADSQEVVARTRCAPKACWSSEDLNLTWPQNVYSLSHVAIPFTPTDPMYGSDATTAYVENMRLGTLQPRGERRVLLVPVEQLTLLRYNPFFSYLEQRVIEFCTDCDPGS